MCARPPLNGEDEVAALIATLHTTEQRLEALTGGEVDTVLSGSGQPFMLRRAQAELRNREAAKQAAILNALPTQIALLDAHGRIVSVNETWRRFASANSFQGSGFGVGLNYLDVCDRARGEDSADAHRVAAGIRAVLAGAAKFLLEYPCHSPTVRRWFQLMVTPLSADHARGAIVMHVDISERRLAEAAMRESEAAMAAAQQIGHFGSWEIELGEANDVDASTLHWSDEMFRIAGYEPGAVEVTNRLFFSRVPPEEHEPIRLAMAAAIRERRPYAIAHRFLRPDGATRIVQETAKIFYNDQTGRPEKIVGTAHDITESKQAEAAFAELSQKTERRERMLTTMLSHITDFTYLYDRQGRFLFANQPLLDLWGRTLDEIVGKNFLDLGYPDDLAVKLERQVQAVFETGKPLTDETPYTSPGGATGFYEYIFSPVFGANGAVEFVVGATRDITERIQVATELRRSRDEFQELAASMPQIVWITRPDGWNTYFNQHWMDYTGLRLEESLGHGWNKPFHPDDQQRAMEAWQHATATSGIYSLECRLRRADGIYRWWLIRGVPISDATGKVLKWFGTCTDIHDLKAAELKITEANESLQLSKERLRAALSASGTGTYRWDISTNGLDWDNSLDALFGLPPGQTIRSLDAFLGTVHPADRPEVIARCERCARDGADFAMEFRVVWPDGSLHWVDDQGMTFRDAAGQPSYLTGACIDITARKHTEQTLRESEQRFKALFEQAAVGVALAEAGTGRIVQINQRYCEILGRSREELEQLTFSEISHPDDATRDRISFGQLNAGTRREFTREKRYLRKDGSVVWVSLTVSAMWALGETSSFIITVAQDLTERKKLEEQFRQAQKMEAMGTLAGGIAHDFNNILAAINGFTQLAQLKLEGNPAVREYLGAVLQAGNRATALVRQILAFSRQEQLKRSIVSLRPIVEESLNLLRAAIPATIEIVQSLAPDAPTVLADSTQIHQILMNLGTNAWHAMREKPGRLEVKLERQVVDAAFAAAQYRLRPGVYARISISDTGCGMDRATLQRIFDPFFTTKPPGEGTGLGLAVVHGIMESHDGAVTVYSQPGEGTVFHLYFPASAGAAVAAAGDEGPVPSGHGERILFVDDEELLVELGRQALTELGYQVEVVTQPAAALALVRSEPERFALVITDQTMPGMTGMALASQLQQIRPDLPILLMTGYGMALTPEWVQAAGIHQLLLKPATLHSLGVAVHAALSSQPPTDHG